MRIPFIILLIAGCIVSAGCSCQKSPNDGTASDATIDTAEPASTPPQARAETPVDPPTRTVLSPLQTRAMLDVGELMQRYLNDLAKQDPAAADLLWTGGKPSAGSDDALLRTALEGLRSIRIKTEAPVPLDELDPARSFEVPVNLRVEVADGQLTHIRGHYRLAVKPGTESTTPEWQIVSAELRSQLR